MCKVRTLPERRSAEINKKQTVCYGQKQAISQGIPLLNLPLLSNLHELPQWTLPGNCYE